jgi:hypothetical protein
MGRARKKSLKHGGEGEAEKIKLRNRITGSLVHPNLYCELVTSGIYLLKLQRGLSAYLQIHPPFPLFPPCFKLDLLAANR